MPAGRARDWRNRGLRVTVEVRAKRGPRPVPGQRRPRGTRIVPWTDCVRPEIGALDVARRMKTLRYSH
ncbi:MAG TPA: hypothetical protein VFE84_08720, partial [Patescibacteria group bacterium]|nr:hypothetical protein [Patescibacteria group bacterium]